MTWEDPFPGNSLAPTAQRWRGARMHLGAGGGSSGHPQNRDGERGGNEKEEETRDEGGRGNGKTHTGSEHTVSKEGFILLGLLSKYK